MSFLMRLLSCVQLFLAIALIAYAVVNIEAGNYAIAAFESFIAILNIFAREVNK